MLIKAGGAHKLYHFHNQYSYEKLRKLIKKKRMTINSFGRRAGLSKTDLYRMQIDQLMSIEGEYQACAFFHCDTCDIRENLIVDPPVIEEFDVKTRECRTTRYYYFE